MQAHGDRDPAAVHEQPHLHDRVRPVLLADTVSPESRQYFTGLLVDHFVLFLAFKIEVRAVVVQHGSVPFHNLPAFFVKPGKVFVMVFFQYVHEPQDMLVSEGRLLVIRVQPVPDGEL